METANAGDEWSRKPKRVFNSDLASGFWHYVCWCDPATRTIYTEPGPGRKPCIVTDIEEE